METPQKTPRPKFEQGAAWMVCVIVSAWLVYHILWNVCCFVCSDEEMPDHHSHCGCKFDRNNNLVLMGPVCKKLDENPRFKSPARRCWERAMKWGFGADHYDPKPDPEALRAALEAVAAESPGTPFGTMKSYSTTVGGTINSVQFNTETASPTGAIHRTDGNHLRAPPNSPASVRYRSPYCPHAGSRSDPQVEESHELSVIGSGEESADAEVFGPLRVPPEGAKGNDGSSVRSRASVHSEKTAITI